MLSRLLVVAFLFLAASLLAACPETMPPAGAPCALTSECGGGQCWRGRCIARCSADAECGNGNVCSFGVCGGLECATAADCAAGQRCASSRLCLSGAVGATPIGSPCTAGAQCETGICLPAAIGGTCAAACTDSASCANAAKVCAPVRVSRGSSGSPDAVVSACVDLNMSAATVGVVCVSDADCGTHACREGQCALSCDDDADCLLGQTCRAVAYDAGSPRMCWYPDATGIEVRRALGPGIAVTTGQASQFLQFAVPPNVVGITINGVQAGGTRMLLAWGAAMSPRNESLMSISQIVAGVDQPLRWVPSRKELDLGLLIPNSTSERIGVIGGRYQLVLTALPRSPTDTTVETTTVTPAIFVKVAPTQVSGGTLDFNFHLVGVGVTAASAMSDARITTMLTEMRRILGQANIMIGQTRFFDVPEPAATNFSVIDSIQGTDAEMLQLFAAGQRDNGGVNVFLVRQISTLDGVMALGSNGGIPAVFIPGSANNGVVVTFDPAIVGPEPMGSMRAAQIAAHETCHYLGLYHNREFKPPCPDGTPETASCSPFGAGDTLADTSPDDGSNLMFYQLGGFDMTLYNTAISAGQAYVIQRSPLVH